MRKVYLSAALAGVIMMGALGCKKEEPTAGYGVENDQQQNAMPNMDEKKMDEKRMEDKKKEGEKKMDEKKESSSWFGSNDDKKKQDEATESDRYRTRTYWDNRKPGDK